MDSRVDILGHHDMAKPPLRPDAPPPHRSRSSTMTRAVGCMALAARAVHRPTNPPPTMAMSTLWRPRRPCGADSCGTACLNQ
ncbi:Uncharacterised protein [Bordetella pertussis]|nr:Uncharacterised protein [Bordetella pertussis]CFW45223.1 Uncharacterised protein [Bordetella pertussis]